MDSEATLELKKKAAVSAVLALLASEQGAVPEPVMV